MIPARKGKAKARCDLHTRFTPVDEEGASSLAEKIISLLEEWLWHRREEGEK